MISCSARSNRIFYTDSLGAIYHLCENDPEAARKAIKRYLRISARKYGKPEEPWADCFCPSELNHVTNYLYLEQQRFGDKLQVIYQIRTENFLIPPLTLQPLVENAVRRGILNRRNGGTVIIRTEETDEYAVVVITDNGIGIEKAKELVSLGEHAHIGIENVRSRLKETVDGSLEIESSSQGTTATILYPLGMRYYI